MVIISVPLLLQTRQSLGPRKKKLGKLAWNQSCLEKNIFLSFFLKWGQEAVILLQSSQNPLQTTMLAITVLAASMATASLPPSQILMYNKSKDSIQLSSTPGEYTFIIGVFGSNMVLFAIAYFQGVFSTFQFSLLVSDFSIIPYSPINSF